MDFHIRHVAVSHGDAWPAFATRTHPNRVVTGSSVKERGPGSSHGSIQEARGPGPRSPCWAGWPHEHSGRGPASGGSAILHLPPDSGEVWDRQQVHLSERRQQGQSPL